MHLTEIVGRFVPRWAALTTTFVFVLLSGIEVDMTYFADSTGSLYQDLGIPPPPFSLAAGFDYGTFLAWFKGVDWEQWAKSHATASDVPSTTLFDIDACVHKGEHAAWFDYSSIRTQRAMEAMQSTNRFLFLAPVTAGELEEAHTSSLALHILTLAMAYDALAQASVEAGSAATSPLLIDAGSGTGVLAAALAVLGRSHHAQVLAIEKDAAMLALSQRILPSATVWAGPPVARRHLRRRVSVVQGDLFSPHGNQSATFINLGACVREIPAWVAVALRPGGIVAVALCDDADDTKAPSVTNRLRCAATFQALRKNLRGEMVPRGPRHSIQCTLAR
jgi:protein-L-isoaspartate O-methyltransferase